MIQRIQSIWLLLATLCSAATLQFSFYSGTNAKGEASYLLTAKETGLLLITTLLIIGVCAATLFLFKKRALQLKLCLGTVVLQLILIILYYLQTRTFSTGTFSLTSLLGLFVILFLLLAAKAINKDEKMVKNSDRLR
jgi:hypothetical protein